LLVEELPYHHRDPFDRMLVAQAIHEGLAILSGDDAFDDYPARRVW
jgi:PIN domain nuclease of toxin-antitoxin system